MEAKLALNDVNTKKGKSKKLLQQLYIELVKLQKKVIASDLKLLVILGRKRCSW